MRPRRSTAILAATWLATFVLYIFVKPDQPLPAEGSPAVEPASAAVPADR